MEMKFNMELQFFCVYFYLLYEVEGRCCLWKTVSLINPQTPRVQIQAHTHRQHKFPCLSQLQSPPPTPPPSPITPHRNPSLNPPISGKFQFLLFNYKQAKNRLGSIGLHSLRLRFFIHRCLAAPFDLFLSPRISLAPFSASLKILLPSVSFFVLRIFLYSSFIVS